MKFKSSNYNVGYPVYGAKFLNDSMLLVAGGGGEGNNGIPNKLTVLRVNFDKTKIIKRFREITLDPNDDSPTTLDAANNVILMGCNENSEKIKSGQGNQHLRKFLYENEHLKFVASVDFDGSKSPEDYTKLIYMSHDGSVGALASSKTPTVIRVIDPQTLEEKYEIETGHDVKDMHFAPDGKVISYITASTLEVISIVTGRFIIRKTDFDRNYILSKIRFLTDDTLLIAASLKTGNGIVMIKISLKSGVASVLKTKMITNKFKGVTSMDVDSKSQLAVLAGNDNSVSIVKLGDLSLGKMFKQVHNFAITRVTFSPDSKYVASVSAANTVNVMDIPDKFASSTSIVKKIWKLFLNFVLIVIIAALGQLAYKYDVGNKVFKFLRDQYITRRQKSGAIDILKQTTLVGDIVSQETITRPQSTANSVVETTAFLTNSATAAGADLSDDVWSSELLTTSGYDSRSTEDPVPSQSTDPSNAVEEASPSAEPFSSRKQSTDSSIISSTEAPGTRESVSAKLSSKLEEASAVSISSGSSKTSSGNFVASSSTASKPISTQEHITSSVSSILETTPTPEISSKDDYQLTSSVSIEESFSSGDGSSALNESSQEFSTDSTKDEQSDEVTRQLPLSESGLLTMHSAHLSGNTMAGSIAPEESTSAQGVRSSSKVAVGGVTSLSKSTSSSSSLAYESPKVQYVDELQESHGVIAEDTMLEVPSTTSQTRPNSATETHSTSFSSTSTEELQLNERAQASNIDVGYGLLEKKTPEPTEELDGGEELVTPTDTLESGRISSDDEFALPSDFVSLETGRDQLCSKPSGKQDASEYVSDITEPKTTSTEIEIYVEVPSTTPQSYSVASTEKTSLSTEIQTSPRGDGITAAVRPATKSADKKNIVSDAVKTELTISYSASEPYDEISTLASAASRQTNLELTSSKSGTVSFSSTTANSESSVVPNDHDEL